jgi:hypothetical protein
MKNRAIKLAFLLVVPMMVALSTPTSWAYPPFLARAEKYGAKDCTFCHTRPSGGEGWNERGEWLRAEKKRRNVERVDVDWLADYKGK